MLLISQEINFVAFNVLIIIKENEMYYKPGTHICSSEKHTTRAKPSDIHALHIIATMEIKYQNSATGNDMIFIIRHTTVITFR